MCEAYARAGLALLPMRADPPPLTQRETECLRGVAAGRSDPQIGMILGLSSNTVHAHVEAAKRKLDANSRAQLVLRAVDGGYPPVRPLTRVSVCATAEGIVWHRIHLLKRGLPSPGPG